MKVSATAPPPGYQGFGSFHSDNVELLIATPDEEYRSPPRLDGAVMERRRLRDRPAFGSDTMRASFFLDPSWTFVNHGAFGAAARVAHESAAVYRDYAESQPLRFIDRELLPHMVSSLRAVARLVHAPPSRLTFIPNATYGMNVAIRSAGLQRGDVVYALDVCYGSVKKMLLDACEGAGATLVLHPLRFPLATGEGAVGDLLSQVEGSMPSRVALAVFDHVASNTGLVLPIAALASIAKSRGALVSIDGAHGMQSQELRLDSLGDVDWYTTNCHKWLCSTKGVGLLYASQRVVQQTKPIVISHGFGAGFVSSFIWDGTRDYSGFLALPALLEWWEWVGGHEEARMYCRDLLREAAALLCAAWGTPTHAPLCCYSHMACVELPERALPAAARGGAATSVHAKAVQDALHYDHAVECPVKCLGGRLYLRISAAVYNRLADFEALAEAVRSLTPAPGGGE